MNQCRAKFHRLIACLASLVLGTGIASAQNIISFSFSGNGDVTPQSGYLDSTDLAGAPGVRTGNWNNLLSSADTTHPSTVVFDGIFGDEAGETTLFNDGSTVGGGFSFTGPVGFSDRTSGSFSNDREMFNGVRDVSGLSTITLANIPFAQYEIYCYMFDDGAGRIGTYEIGSTKYYVRGGVGIPDSTGAGYVLSTDTTTGTLLADHDQGNYVRFTGLTGGTVTLSVNALGLEGNLARNKMAGLQIVSVPEPGTAALFGVGALAGMLVLRRRR
jgi:hypothetical protein